MTTGTVEVLHRGQRVASHVGNTRRGGFTTIVEHMPAWHRAHMEWTPQRLIHWGQDIGACQYRHVRDILANNRDQNEPAMSGDWVSPDHAHVRGPSYYQ